jgi:hypothetical protein
LNLAASKRWAIWAAALAGTLWMVLQVEDQDEPAGIVEVAVKPRLSSGVGGRETNLAQLDEVATSLDWEVLAGRYAERGKESDLFKAHSWYVPPPPKPVQAVAPPKPVAPPAPFSYLGKLEDTPTGTLIFLSGGSKVHTVTIGETIDQTWRLDGEDAASLRFTYIPLSLPQTLSKSARPQAAKPNETQGVPG